MAAFLVYFLLLCKDASVSPVTWEMCALAIHAVLLTVLLTVYAVVAPTENNLEQWLNTRLPVTTITTGFTSGLKYINLKIPFKIRAQAKLFSSLLHMLEKMGLWVSHQFLPWACYLWAISTHLFPTTIDDQPSPHPTEHIDIFILFPLCTKTKAPMARSPSAPWNRRPVVFPK